MLDVLHQRFNCGSAIAIVPRNDVVHRIGFRLSSFWAHVLILLSQSLKFLPVLKRRAPPRR